MKFFKRTLLMNEISSTAIISVNGSCKADGG